MDQSIQAAPAYFQTLLDRGTKRNVDEPQLQLGLQDIARKVRKLGKGDRPTSSLAHDTKAHYLLSASGVNTSRAIAELEDLVSTTTHETPATAVAGGVGVKDTLAQQYQSDFQKMVDGHIKRAHDDFDRMIEEKLHGVDWDAHRTRIYQHFGLKKPPGLAEGGASAIDMSLAGKSSFGRSGRQSRFAGGASLGRSAFGVSHAAKSVIGTPGPRGARSSVFGDMAEKMPEGLRPAPEDSLQRKKQEKYADRVKDLNVARLQKTVYPIFAKFAEVESERSNEDTSMLVNALNALIEITGEDASKSLSDASVVKERQFMHDYLDDNTNSPQQLAIRRRIINGARRFLEKNFLTHLESVVAKSPREANMGGIPTALARVKGYVRIRAVKKELGPDIELLQELNGDYCWPVIFYLLRSGLFQEALQYVEENAPAFRQIDRSFPLYLQAYVTSDDRRLSEKLSLSIENEYSARRRLAPQDQVDPYQMMCYKIIGRCELSRRSFDGPLMTDMMDWIWLQFSLARESLRSEEFQHHSFNLADVQASIRDIGEKYFGAGSEIANAPTTFFFMQILAGMFEKAVAELYPHNYLAAVHFAIALDFYGLLRVSNLDHSDDLLTTTTRGQPQIAFGALVALYTRDFRTADATAAVDYITLLCLNADLTGDIGRAQRELCHQALAEVVLETREFAQLLGDIRSDGQRILGAIEARLPLIGLADEREYLKHITVVAARTAEEAGRTTDAALLFHLAEDYNKVLQVVNDAVSQYLTTDLGETPARLMPLKPRQTDERNGAPDQPGSSLSLIAVDEPVQLAKNYRNLYSSDAMYSKHIDRKNSEACEVLLQLAEARRLLEVCQWSEVIDAVTKSDILPTNLLSSASGNMSAIRSKAQAFEVLPAVISRTVGHVMVWTVVSCSNLAERLRRQEFENGIQQQTISRCVQTAKDIMVFAGLIRYKLPARVWETLARVGQDLGAY